jgi:hypothetical protein
LIIDEIQPAATSERPNSARSSTMAIGTSLSPMLRDNC